MIRSLKIIFYRYMEDFVYKYIHKQPQFITTLNSRRDSYLDMRPFTIELASNASGELFPNNTLSSFMQTFQQSK